MASGSDHVDAQGEDKKFDDPDARGYAGGDSLHLNFHPTMKESDFTSVTYKISFDEMGLALIINNKNFDGTKLNNRSGTDVDAERIKKIFHTLQFNKVRCRENLKALDIKKEIQIAAQEDHYDRAMFACVILSHGEEGKVYGCDGKEISMDDITEPFKGNNCQSLAGKPKLFFIQACKEPEGETATDGPTGEEESEEVIVARRIPREADFFMVTSVVPGCFAWRNQIAGSWFIQAICDVFSNNWKELDILTLMTRVIKQVANNFETKMPREFDKEKKRIPCITSMLTKDLFFK